MIPKSIPEIKKILYATDLSRNARYAFAYAISLADRYDAGITVLHVVEDISPYADSLVINILGHDKWDELREKNTQRVLEEIRERLEKFCEDVSNELPECRFITDKVIVTVGNPVEEILREIKSSDPDIVLMGAHGHGVLSDAVLGSVSRRVLRRCAKPVMIIRLPEDM